MSQQEAEKVLEQLKEQKLVPDTAENDEAIIAIVALAIESAFADGNKCGNTMSFLQKLKG